jgi:Polyketide cyclase / dehydrase and lipid transport
VRKTPVLACAAATLAGDYALLVRGALTLDLDLGRRVLPLGPIALRIAAPPETVFDVIAAPYLGRTPRAMQDKLRVLERGTDMVLAAHYTKAGAFTTVTVETVRFERPDRVSFRLVRGPVPHVIESYELTADANATEFTYSGEIGADLWALGAWWAARVKGPWERTVAHALEAVKAEAERRAR